MIINLTTEDINSATAQIENNLGNVQNASSGLSDRIDLFISQSESKLQGEGYDFIRNKLRSYQAGINKLVQLCTELANKIRTVNNMLINSKLGYDFNNVDIDELKRKKEKLLLDLQDYLSLVVINPDDPKEKQVKMIKDKKQAEATKSLIEEIDRILEAYESLMQSINQAKSALTESTGDIGKFSNAVNEIQVSSF